MTTWGRLTDLINNGRELTYGETLFFVFSQEHIQLFAIELNTGSPNNSEYGQLFLQGIDVEGTPLSDIGGDYALSTERIKRATGLPFDRVTLYQEGDLYKSWDFIQKSDSFVLSANTVKEGVDLRERWGPDFIGLTNESINELCGEVVPEIISYVLRSLLQ